MTSCVEDRTYDQLISGLNSLRLAKMFKNEMRPNLQIAYGLRVVETSNEARCT
jgi:hypothetical protein